MVGGYLRKNDSSFLPDTRISNSTFIDHPKGFNVANDVYIGHHNFIECSHKVTIETGCQITSFVSVTSHSSHDSIRLYGAAYKGKTNLIGYQKGAVFIGAYTYVGPHTTIMPGSKIGKGCLIAAYSYVQGDFPDFSIIKGNPAAVVGSTKDRDSAYLKENSELQQYYNEWAKD